MSWLKRIIVASRAKEEERVRAGNHSVPAGLLRYDPEENAQYIDSARKVLCYRASEFGWFAHGTNGKAFEGIVNAQGIVLPASELQQRGLFTISGETAGLVNPDCIATVELSCCRKYHGNGPAFFKGFIDETIGYANLATETGVRPRNIRTSIEKIRRYQDQCKRDLPTPESNGGKILAGSSRVIEQLAQLEKKFTGMGLADRIEWDRLSDIPVVVMGRHFGRTEHALFTSVEGEAFIKQLKITTGIVASEPKYLTELQTMARKNNVPLFPVPLGALEILQQDYLRARYGRSIASSAD